MNLKLTEVFGSFFQKRTASLRFFGHRNHASRLAVYVTFKVPRT
jgi:hypothetical protein